MGCRGRRRGTADWPASASQSGYWRNGNKKNWVMAKQNDEEIFEQYLQGQFEAGTLNAASKMKMLEEFRSARAQQSASTYAFHAAIAAGMSAAFAAASVAISLYALFSK
jgi:hypothetical protein